MSTERYQILGVAIDALTMAEAAELIVGQATDKQQSARYVVKPYVEFLDRAAREPKTVSLLNHAWLSLPDAISIQWAATYLYGGKASWWRVMSLGASIIFRPSQLTGFIPEKFSGAVFTWKVLERAAENQARVYLIGSPVNSDISVTAETITQRLPQSRIVGSWPGHLGGKQGAVLRQALKTEPIEAELVSDLKATKPDLILVGMGFPLQEELMAKLAPQLSHGVLIGEGGTFDYDSFGGVRKKAPAAMQKIGLEWLWRLIREPRRIRRQLAIPRFIWTVYRSSKNAKNN